MGQLLATIGLASGTCVIYVAALAKAPKARELAATLSQLMPLRGWTPVAAASGVIVLEFATVVVVVSGSPVIAAVMFCLLGLGFAAAGTRALLQETTVACACFGSTSHVLGWRQIAALPAWGLVALCADEAGHEAGSARVLALAVVTVIYVVMWSIPALRGWSTARADRRALAGA
jgi:hypothetical protein